MKTDKTRTDGASENPSLGARIRRALNVALLASGGLLIPAFILDAGLAGGPGMWAHLAISLYALTALGGLWALACAFVFEFADVRWPAAAQLRQWADRPEAPSRLLTWGVALLFMVTGFHAVHHRVAHLFITGFKNKDLSGYMLNFFEYFALVSLVLGVLALARILRFPVAVLDKTLARAVSGGWRSLAYVGVLAVAALTFIGVLVEAGLAPLTPRVTRMLLLAILLVPVVALGVTALRHHLYRLQQKPKTFGGLRIACALLLGVSLVVGGMAASHGEAVDGAISSRPAAALGQLWLPMASVPPPPAKPAGRPGQKSKPVRNAR